MTTENWFAIDYPRGSRTTDLCAVHQGSLTGNITGYIRQISPQRYEFTPRGTDAIYAGRCADSAIRNFLLSVGE